MQHASYDHAATPQGMSAEGLHATADMAAGVEKSLYELHDRLTRAVNAITGGPGPQLVKGSGPNTTERPAGTLPMIRSSLQGAQDQIAALFQVASRLEAAL